MKRIFYLITSSDFGGAETLLYQCVLALDKNKYQALVCSVKPKGAVARKIEENGIRVESLDFDAKRDGALKICRAFSRLCSLIREFKPDILHASLFQADILAALAGASCRVPSRIATVHMVMKAKWPQLLLERLAAPWLTHFIAVSEDIRNFYAGRLFLPASKISVIHNVVDGGETVRRAAEIERLPIGLLPKMPWVACVGRLDKQKALPVLFSSLKSLKDRGIQAGAVLAGEGPERRRLEILARELGIASHLYFAGFQPNPMPFIAQSRGLVLSSDEEGLPFVILEAMALGKPVISTDVGAVPEAVIHERTGLLVPARNPGALAEALARILLNQEFAEKLGVEGKKLVAEKFSLEPAKRKLETLYQKFSS